VAHVTAEANANREIHPAEPAGGAELASRDGGACDDGKAKEIYPLPSPLFS
jgi:hypothetical protein